MPIALRFRSPASRALVYLGYKRFQQFVRGYSQVVFPQQLNARISSARRATRLTYAALLLPVGFVADYGGVIFTMQVAGVGAAVLGGLALAGRYARS